ncbi:DUF6318 family protein [Nesterenkonia halobia]|uniref:DUF6318 domain-containing protein n=1 Tax=Nesterenkonia halobia TaxID=37922 RepID=A0ABP6R8N7_9MICC
MTPVATETDLTTDDGAARVRRLPLMGVVLAGALLLSACGGSPEEGAEAGSEEPSASSSSEETGDGGSGEESASPDEPSGTSGNDGSSEEGSGESVPASSEGPAENWSEPAAPAQLTENSEEGAEATLKYWWELDAYARNTGDTDPLKAISGDDCTFCINRVNRVIKTYDEGDWWTQESHKVGRVGLTNQGDGTFKGLFEIDEGSFTAYYDTAEAEPVEGEEGQSWGALLKYDGEHWVVRDLSSLPDDSNTEDDS